jgi:hypothetical protein
MCRVARNSQVKQMGAAMTAVGLTVEGAGMDTR